MSRSCCSASSAVRQPRLSKAIDVKTSPPTWSGADDSGCPSGLLGNTASGPQPEITGLGRIHKADLVQSYALAQRVHRVICERSNLVRDLPASKPPPFGCDTDHVYFFKANTWPISRK